MKGLTMYGGGWIEWIGKKVKFVDKIYGGIEDKNEWGEKFYIVSPERTPQYLVNKLGTLIDVIDYAYDTDSRQLTGYENIVLEIELDEPILSEKTVYIDSRAVIKERT